MNQADLIRLIDAPVYLADEEIDKLTEYATGVEGIIVDIGAGFGASASLFLMSSKARVVSIDPFTSEPGAFSPTCGVRTAEACKRNVSRVHQDDRWTLLYETSHNAFLSWPRTPISLLFIDGDHRYNGIKQDWEDWFQFVKPDGIIILHDSRKMPGVPEDEYCRGHVGPTKLADELRQSKDVTLIEEFSSLTIWKKV
jgi:predicted O-methyltransferase YrrM